MKRWQVWIDLSLDDASITKEQVERLVYVALTNPLFPKGLATVMAEEAGPAPFAVKMTSKGNKGYN